MISVKHITVSDPLYIQEQDLRNRILLRPIGMPDHAWETDDHKAWHFVAVDEGTVIGCVILVPLGEEWGQAQLKQMAVETRYQSKGVGRQLLGGLMEFARRNQVAEVTCHARETAIPFYEKNGFEIYDEPFTEVGITHRHMKKHLS